MKCLLLALSVALVCGSQDTNVPQITGDLDIQKVAGTWYSMVMAASDFTLLNTEGAPLRLHLKELRPTPEGNLEIIVHRWEGSSCVEKKIFAEKTEDPTQFKVKDPMGGAVQVVDTDYENFAFLCIEGAASLEQSLACQYLARTPKLSEEAMEKFDSAMKLLPSHIQLHFTPTRAKERCLV
ncbi:glycodelin [Molossus molossus]|uniref:Progestagen associated endometrial protein n=1 Tax=Molossus molossus TaxID=27622 RepID=A0A7J8EFR4_MOLMO|nr:glycodelin [Molossus molossus]KAF6434115.1 progestagen associated endometrial protein [Molossus molossus]